MKAIKAVRQVLLRGRELENSGKLKEAAQLYQSILDSEPSNHDALTRMLIVYRKLKEPRKELAVINRALDGFEHRDNLLQEKWINEHPRAAGAGKAVLRQMGGSKYSAFDVDPVANRLLKRKEIVEKQMGIGNAKPVKTVTRIKAKATRKTEDDAAAVRAEKIAVLKRRKEAAEKIKAVAQEKKDARARKEAEAAERKVAKEQREAKTRALKAEQAAAKKAALKAKSYPTLFVINLQYLVPLDQIDAEMHNHVVFLDKYYNSGQILMSGRQVPRTGGIIIARAKDRDAAIRMMKDDPFFRKKLASMDIVEFSASRISKKVTLHK